MRNAAYVLTGPPVRYFLQGISRRNVPEQAVFNGLRAGLPAAGQKLSGIRRGCELQRCQGLSARRAVGAAGDKTNGYLLPYAI